MEWPNGVKENNGSWYNAAYQPNYQPFPCPTSGVPTANGMNATNAAHTAAWAAYATPFGNYSYPPGSWTYGTSLPGVNVPLPNVQATEANTSTGTNNEKKPNKQTIVNPPLPPDPPPKEPPPPLPKEPEDHKKSLKFEVSPLYSKSKHSKTNHSESDCSKSDYLDSEHSKSGRSKSDRSRSSHSRSDRSKSGRSKSDRPIVESSKSDQPKVGIPKSETKLRLPKSQVPKHPFHAMLDFDLNEPPPPPPPPENDTDTTFKVIPKQKIMNYNQIFQGGNWLGNSMYTSKGTDKYTDGTLPCPTISNSQKQHTIKFNIANSMSKSPLKLESTKPLSNFEQNNLLPNTDPTKMSPSFQLTKPLPNSEPTKSVQNLAQTKFMANFDRTMTVTNFEQSNSLPQFEQSNPLPHFEQSKPLLNFERAALVSNFEQNKSLPDYVQPKRLSDFEQSKLLPDIEQAKIRSNFEQTNVIPDFERNNPLSEYERTMSIHNFDSAKSSHTTFEPIDLLSKFGPSESPHKFEPSKSLNFQRTNQPADYQPYIPPNFQSNIPPPDFNPSKPPPNFQLNKPPSSFPPPNLPLGFQPNKLPPNYDGTKQSPKFEQQNFFNKNRYSDKKTDNYGPNWSTPNNQFYNKGNAGTPPKPDNKRSTGLASDPTVPPPSVNVFTAGDWPESLKSYVGKCFARCVTEVDKDQVEICLKGKLTLAAKNRTLWQKDWDEEELIGVYSVAKQENNFKTAPSKLVNPELGDPSRGFHVTKRSLSVSRSRSNSPDGRRRRDRKYSSNLEVEDRGFISFRGGKGNKKSGRGRKNSNKFNFGNNKNEANAKKGAFFAKSGMTLDPDLCTNDRLNKRAARFSDMVKRGGRNRGRGGGGAVPAAKRRKNLNLSASINNSFTLDDNSENMDWSTIHVMGTSTELEKQYLRLTKAPDPSTVRTVATLRRSLIHIKNIWKESHKYKFICNQLKSIRQDLTVQGIRDEFTREVYETHCRIALEQEDHEEFNQCQTQLKDLYSHLGGSCQLEFVAYRLLYFIYTSNTLDMTSMLASLSETDKKDPCVSFALKLRAAWSLSNYYKFFKLYRNSPKMTGFLVDWFIEKERKNAIKTMVKSYRPGNVGVEYVKSTLAFSEEDWVKFVETVGLTFTDRTKKIIDCKAAVALFAAA